MVPEALVADAVTGAGGSTCTAPMLKLGQVTPALKNASSRYVPLSVAAAGEVAKGALIAWLRVANGSSSWPEGSNIRTWGGDWLLRLQSPRAAAAIRSPDVASNA